MIFGGWDGGLYRVPAAGGAPEPLTVPERYRSHRWPTMLPDGEAVLFSVVSSFLPPDIWVRSLESEEERVIVENATFPRYAPTGHLLYVSDGALWAVEFDDVQLAVVGAPVQVVDGVLIKGAGSSVGAADVGIGANGTLQYERWWNIDVKRFRSKKQFLGYARASGHPSDHSQDHQT